MSLQIIPIHLKNDIQPSDDLVDLLLSSSKTSLENGDVLVISQKIISKHEGRVVNIDSIIPSELSIGIASAYDKYPKLNDQDDFNFTNIQKRLCAPMNILPGYIIHFNDPDELRIIINEIFTMLKNKQFGYDRCRYWILWLLRYEAIHKKKKTPWNIDERNIVDIPKKYRGNIVWVLWEIIFEEMKLRNNKKRSY